MLTISGADSFSRRFAPQHVELVSKNQDFRLKPCSRPEQPGCLRAGRVRTSFNASGSEAPHRGARGETEVTGRTAAHIVIKSTLTWPVCVPETSSGHP